MENFSKQTAEYLLQIKAIKLQPSNPFTWASGWKSPIYCDNRKTLSFPEVRSYIRDSFAVLVSRLYPDAEMIAGVATGAIAHGALAADKLGLPFIYVRSGAKEHGLGNQIEGYYQPGQPVLVIEDLVSTGKSSLQVVDVLRNAGVEVIGMVSIFNYGFPQAQEAFDKAGVPLHSLTQYGTLIETATESGQVASDQLATLQQWRENPAQWNV